MKKKRKFGYDLNKGYLIIAVTICVIFWDFILKVITDGNDISFINGFIGFYSVHNYGAAWSMFSGHTIWLTIITAIVIVAMIVFVCFFKFRTRLFSISFGLILGGAVGNLIDRVFLGYVRDFIRFEFWPSFPTFNIADCCLVIGVVLMCVFILFQLPKAAKQGKLKGLKARLKRAESPALSVKVKKVEKVEEANNG